MEVTVEVIVGSVAGETIVIQLAETVVVVGTIAGAIVVEVVVGTGAGST